MEIPNYESFTNSDRFNRRFRRFWFWFLISIAVLIPVAVSAVCVRLWFFEGQIRQVIQNFDQSTSEGKLMGKSPDQIIALLGKPTDDTINNKKNWTDPAKERVICYYGPWGEICRIEISDGVATRVEHYGK